MENNLPVLVEQEIYVEQSRSSTPCTISTEFLYFFCQWSIVEWKLFCIVAAHLAKIKDSISRDEKEHCPRVLIPISSLAKTLGMSISNAKTCVGKAILGLKEKGAWRIRTDSNCQRYIDTEDNFAVLVVSGSQFESFTAGTRRRNCAVIQLSGEMKRYILDIEGTFFKDNLGTLLKFKSPHALRLYMLFSLACKQERSNRVTRSLRTETLRLLLGIPDGEQKRFTDLYRRVIAPAIKEVNRSGLIFIDCDVERRRGGENLIHFTIGREPVIESPPELRQEETDRRVKEAIRFEKDKKLVKTCMNKGAKKEFLIRLVDEYGYESVKAGAEFALRWSKGHDFSRVLKSWCRQSKGGGEDA